MLTAAGATLAVAAASPTVTGRELTLLPDAGGITMADIGVAVLPDLLFSIPRQVRIEGEVRVQIVNPD